MAWSADPLGCWLVVDDAAWETVGRWGTTPPNPYLLEHGAVVHEAPSLEKLAQLAGLPPAVLAAEAAHGRPPYRAVPLVAGITFTLGGLLVDGKARVLDACEAPSPGLFAAGGTMGGLHGGPHAGYVGGLLEAAVFGLIAGEEVVKCR